MSFLINNNNNRCRKCNAMLRTARKLRTHVRAECPLRETVRAKNSPVGRLVQNSPVAIHTKHVKHIPEVKMKDEDGNVMLDDDGNERHVPNVYQARVLGHQCTADRNTMVDVEHRMAAATREFNKGMHMWTHPRLRIKAKLRMFRRHLMQLIYAGAQCWLRHLWM